MNPNVPNIKELKEGTGCWSDFIHEGLFHQWGSAYEDLEHGPGNYTIGLVETPTGEIEEVFPTNILFTS